MRLIKPKSENGRAFDQKFCPVFGLTQTIKKPLIGIPDKKSLQVLARLFELIGQFVADGSRDVFLFLHRAFTLSVNSNKESFCS